MNADVSCVAGMGFAPPALLASGPVGTTYDAATAIPAALRRRTA